MECERPRILGNLFDRVSVEVKNYSDLIAERAGALGGAAKGTIQIAAERSFLMPYPLEIGDENEHVFAVSAALAAFGESAREAIGLATVAGDSATADVFTEICRGSDKQLGFVESHMAPKKKRIQCANTQHASEIQSAGINTECVTAAALEQPRKWASARRASSELHQSIENWVNEGGAGGEDNR